MGPNRSFSPSPPATWLLLLAWLAVAAAQQQGSPAPASSTPANAQQQQQINQTLAYVNGTIPSFYAIRSCLPFTVLVRPQLYNASGSSSSASGGSAAGGNSANGSAQNDARIEILADYYVVNATQAAVTEGVLSLSLMHGFETHWPIQVTVYTSPSRQLRYTANFASGSLLIAPGVNVSSFEIGNSGVGEVLAYGVAADALRVNSTGTGGVFVTGSVSRAVVGATGTGTLTLQSSTPTTVTAELTGISTLVVDSPQGSSINGTADGLSKVQYTTGTCNVGSSAPLAFPVPSIFGRRFGFGHIGGGGIGGAAAGGGGGGGSGSTSSLFGSSKCERVAAAAVPSLVPRNPRWSCGLVVDGANNCAASAAPDGGTNANASSNVINWQVTNLTYVPLTPTSSSAVGNASSSGNAAAGGGANTNASSANAGALPGASEQAVVAGGNPGEGTDIVGGVPTAADENGFNWGPYPGNAAPASSGTDEGTAAAGAPPSNAAAAADTGDSEVNPAADDTNALAPSSNQGGASGNAGEVQAQGSTNAGMLANPVFIPSSATSSLPQLQEPPPAPAATSVQGSNFTAAAASGHGGNAYTFATNVPPGQGATAGGGGTALSISSTGPGGGTSSSTSGTGGTGGTYGVAVASTTCSANATDLAVQGLK